ncbi:fibrinogen-like protein 1 [Drosophila rhopaloa]|uniref:Fibrinogen-like protein 1 n=1 Tax=Drosophila rhopaloa TaxID=1041015 RepID=A0A6P4EWK8_DRORH|nr:fibrinogen-like protein 1 [Drosophila rhopaloa]
MSQEDFKDGIQRLQNNLDAHFQAVQTNIEGQHTEIRNSLKETSAQEDLGATLNRTEVQFMAVNTEIKNQLQEIGSKIITKEDFANSIQALQAKLDAGLNRTEELRMMKITADANDELKSQANTLKDTINYLQSQLKISKGQTKIKEDILNGKEEHLKNKDQQISDLRNKIKLIETTTISKQSEQSSKLSEYQIKLREMEPFKVTSASSPPGWTVIQRRIDGSENFNRTWNDYKSGFGKVSGEFFIGLEKLHRMTEARPHELYIKLGKVNGSTSYAHYNDFKIGSEKELYELKNLGKYSGETGDSLTYSKNQKFSTINRDNDNTSDLNCAFSFGAWWYHKCSESTLNGKYFKNGKGFEGIHWGSWHDNDWEISLTFVEIMIRPKS